MVLHESQDHKECTCNGVSILSNDPRSRISYSVSFFYFKYNYYAILGLTFQVRFASHCTRYCCIPYAVRIPSLMTRPQRKSWGFPLRRSFRRRAWRSESWQPYLRTGSRWTRCNKKTVHRSLPRGHPSRDPGMNK